MTVFVYNGAMNNHNEPLIFAAFNEKHPADTFKDFEELFSVPDYKNPLWLLRAMVDSHLTDATCKTRARCAQYTRYLAEGNITLGESRMAMSAEKARHIHDIEQSILGRREGYVKKPFDHDEFIRRAEVILATGRIQADIADDLAVLPIPHSDALIMRLGLYTPE